MKKYSLILVLIFSFVSFSYGQDFYLGLRSGFKKETYSIVGNGGKEFQSKMNYAFPTTRLIMRAMFSNNLEVGGGLGYYAYNRNVGMIYDNTYGIINVFSGNEALFKSIEFSCQVGYSLPIARDFYLKLNMGIDFNIHILKEYHDISQITETNVSNESADMTIYSPSHRENHSAGNIMLVNTIAFQYFTKFNLGISIFTSYHTGLLPVTYEIAVVYPKNMPTFGFLPDNYLYYTYPYSTRGSYWEFGLELGYRFKKKK